MPTSVLDRPLELVPLAGLSFVPPYWRRTAVQKSLAFFASWFRLIGIGSERRAGKRILHIKLSYFSARSPPFHGIPCCWRPPLQQRRTTPSSSAPAASLRRLVSLPCEEPAGVRPSRRGPYAGVAVRVAAPPAVALTALGAAMRTHTGAAIAAIAGRNVCVLLMYFVRTMADFSWVDNAGPV